MSSGKYKIGDFSSWKEFLWATHRTCTDENCRRRKEYRTYYRSRRTDKWVQKNPRRSNPEETSVFRVQRKSNRWFLQGACKSKGTLSTCLDTKKIEDGAAILEVGYREASKKQSRIQNNMSTMQVVLYWIHNPIFRGALQKTQNSVPASREAPKRMWCSEGMHDGRTLGGFGVIDTGGTISNDIGSTVAEGGETNHKHETGIQKQRTYYNVVTGHQWHFV